MNSELPDNFRGINMTGKTCGLWQVIRFDSKDRYHNIWWWCRCRCGTEKPVTGASLRKGVLGHKGGSTNCGCEKYTKMRTQDGLAKTTEYNIWIQMRDRCSNPKSPYYHRYGGRGIKVCDRWQESFLLFYEDMGSRPSKTHSLDRIDNEGSYSPGNCRWATPDEQYGNTSTNRLIEYKGVTKHLNLWARQLGLSREQLRDRLNRGWSVEDAFELPIKPQIKLLTYAGKTQSIKVWAAELDIEYTSLRKRLANGESIEEIKATYKKRKARLS